jgi:PAS domain S-box-containing protein
LIGYVGGPDIRIDQLLFPIGVSGAAGTAPNWMAPNTALCFILSGASLLTLEVETGGGRRPSQIFALAFGVLALLALIGYLYNTHAFYGVTSFIPMAVHTAGSFLLLSLALLAAHPDRGAMAPVTSEGAGGMLARRVLPACVLVPILLGWLRLIGEKWGVYGTELGVALYAVGNVVFFVIVVWWNAGLLYRFDMERRRMMDALRQSEERHRAVIEQASEGIYLVDAESHQIVEANPAIARLLGYSVEEVRGRPIYDIVRDEREGVDARIRRVIEANVPVVGERQYWKKDGTAVDVGVSAAVIRYGGRNVLCTVVHDITERKRAQKLLEEKNVQLEEAVQSERQAHQKLKDAQSQLVQAEKLAGLGQMVAGVAHEINNPLSFVANNVAVLQRDLKAMRQLLELYRQHDAYLAEQKPEAFADVKDLVERIDLNYTLGNLDEMLIRCREGLRRIQQIVKDLRDFARLDDADQHEADINAGIQSTANIILGRAKKKQVQVQLELGNLPMVVCYPAKVNQVVMNLLANAIDASPEGAIVTVSSRAVDGEVQIEVADRGKGITPEIRSRIFDPFFTTKPLGEGTGLGLSISYGIINDHGGTIEVDSTPGAGSRFTIHLPLQPPEKKKRS